MSISFKTTVRYLWRKRLFTVLKVIGLAIGITACWVIYGIVKYEHSYESGLPGRDGIHRLVTGFIFDEKESYNGGVSKPFYQAIRAEMPSVKRVTPVFGKWFNHVQVPATASKPAADLDDPEHVVAVDSTYFQMVPYRWLAGNAQSALGGPDNIILTESRARSYFGGITAEAMMGRSLVYNDTIRKVVAGVVADLQYATEFEGQEFMVLKPEVYKLNTWTNTNGSDKLYLEFAPNVDSAQVMKGINAIADRKWQDYSQEVKPTFKFKRWFQLIPLSETHFAGYLQESEVHKASKPVLYGLIALGAFILLLACINYINLTTAQIPQRSKEIGVRKTLGGARSSLITQLLSETMITVAIAAGVALLLTRFAFRMLGDMLPEGSFQHATSPAVIVFLLALVLTVTLLSGWYPAWLIAKVKPISIIRGKAAWNGTSRGVSRRKVLIVVQFMIAQAFIIGAVIMGAQLRYTLKKDLGFDKNAVVFIDLPWKFMDDDKYKDRQFTFANELKSIPGVAMVSMGTEPLSSNYSSSQYSYDDGSGKEPIARQVVRRPVDTNYVRLYNLRLLAGRNLLDSDTTIEYVINETAMHGFGFKSPQDAIGKMIGQSDAKFPIAGVVKDFHLQDFHSAILPVALMADKSSLGTFNVKLQGNDPSQWRETIARMELKWNSLYPAGTFNYKYYDDSLEALYKDEHNLAKLINLATIVSILISCLGLFGLATLTALQRSKEIGIRKVLGASVTRIVAMLSSDFVKLIAIALVVATPVAWWAMNRWLADFAYRIRIEWWVFALTGIAAVSVALITVGYQSIRAAIANPVNSLRNE